MKYVFINNKYISTYTDDVLDSHIRDNHYPNVIEIRDNMLPKTTTEDNLIRIDGIKGECKQYLFNIKNYVINHGPSKIMLNGTNYYTTTVRRTLLTEPRYLEFLKDDQLDVYTYDGNKIHLTLEPSTLAEINKIRNKSITKRKIIEDFVNTKSTLIDNTNDINEIRSIMKNIIKEVAPLLTKVMNGDNDPQ